MFKEIGQIASLMQQLPRIQEEMEQLQQRLRPDHRRGRRRRRHGQGARQRPAMKCRLHSSATKSLKRTTARCSKT